MIEYYLIGIVVIEIFLYYLVKSLRSEFQWLITSADLSPGLSVSGLEKFRESGYDPALGWIRKPGNSKKEIGKHGITSYSIGSRGFRVNPGFERKKKKISCYGDSFTFARQVNDNETWSWYLSKFTNSNVLNLGVGNYGLDQSLLRLKREYSLNKTPIVIMGVVPSTIVRCFCMWKHYNEYGNTFGFKPRYVFRNGKLSLIPNFINSFDKFKNYRSYLPEIQKYDYFYKNKFLKEILRFPYIYHFFKNFKRNVKLSWLVSKYKWFDKKSEGGYPAPMKVIMDINLKLRVKMFEQGKGGLLEKIIDEFVSFSKEQGFTPVFLWMPQKDDLIYIRKHGNYYSSFISQVRSKLKVIDMTQPMINLDLDSMYSDDNEYGGHYSKVGNEFVATEVEKEISELIR